MDTKNNDGKTCLHLACWTGDKNVIAQLLRFGANPNEKDGKSGNTCAHVLVQKNDLETLKMIAPDLMLSGEFDGNI